jgi:hypothetical protein
MPIIRSRLLERESPPVPIDDLLRNAGIIADGAVALRASSPDRWVIGLEAGNALVAVAKCGPIDDAGLRHEAAVLSELVSTDPLIRLPELQFAGEVDNRFAMVTRAVPPRIGSVSLDQIADLAARLTNGALGAPRVHGDLAQWNIVRTRDGMWLLDWEHSRVERLPLWDLTDHLFREGVLVGKYTPRRVVGHLIDEHSAGWNHLVAVNEDPSQARQLVRRYLDDRPALGKSAESFEQRMRMCIE